jgi:hypothetical protein
MSHSGTVNASLRMVIEKRKDTKNIRFISALVPPPYCYVRKYVFNKWVIVRNLTVISTLQVKVKLSM